MSTAKTTGELIEMLKVLPDDTPIYGVTEEDQVEGFVVVQRLSTVPEDGDRFEPLAGRPEPELTGTLSVLLH